MTRPDPLTELLQQTRAGLDMIAWMDQADRAERSASLENRAGIIENQPEEA